MIWIMVLHNSCLIMELHKWMYMELHDKLIYTFHKSNYVAP